MSKPKLSKRIQVTGVVVLLAALAALALYIRSVRHPWTRGGQVSSNIVMLTPQVSGQVVRVAVIDGMEVKAGDLLFEIDPRPFQIAVEEAEVALLQARQDVAMLEASVLVAEANVKAAQSNITSAESGVTVAEADVSKAQSSLQEYISERDRAVELQKTGAGSIQSAESKTARAEAGQANLKASKAHQQSAQATLEKAYSGLAQAEANLTQAKANLGEPGENNVKILAAKARLEQAQLNLEWSRVVAPAEGYVTNLVVKPGDFAQAGKPMLAFVDLDSFYVQGYFRETQLAHIRVGDTAKIVLMSFPDEPLRGEVEAIGRAINPPNIAQTGASGDGAIVPTVQPTFDWIRLAQRVPVRIKLTKVPEGVELIAGTTASVRISPKD